MHYKIDDEVQSKLFSDEKAFFPYNTQNVTIKVPVQITVDFRVLCAAVKSNLVI